MTAHRIVITGFRAFPGVANNPSTLVVEALEESGFAARYASLDTVYAKARERIADLLEPAPDALVLTGFSRLATGLVLETRATAACLPDRVDAAGCLPEGPDAGCDHENPAVDADALVAMLAREGLPAETSRDAGGYLCNHVFWQALDLIAERGLATRAIFVHLPLVAGMEEPPDGAGAMEPGDLVRGVGLVAEALAT